MPRKPLRKPTSAATVCFFAASAMMGPVSIQAHRWSGPGVLGRRATLLPGAALSKRIPFWLSDWLMDQTLRSPTGAGLKARSKDTGGEVGSTSFQGNSGIGFHSLAGGAGNIGPGV